MLQSPSTSIESRSSWTVATVALVTMLMAFGAAWITAVALKDIAAEVDGDALDSRACQRACLARLGPRRHPDGPHRRSCRHTMDRHLRRVDDRLGLAISTFGPPWPLWIGHGLFIGLIGLGGINAPMYIYVSRWFDRRRGSALALISSGSYLAGAMWPPVFERVIAGSAGGRPCCGTRLPKSS